MVKKGIIDRFEEKYAVIEVEGGLERIKRELLPPSAQEGDVIMIDGDAITVDIRETEARKDQIKKLMDKLFK